MVGTTNVQNGVVDMANNRPTKTLPFGKYTIVGVDIDTTGRRLIDEIVQLAAFTPNDHFEQYIMPYMNLNPAARQRHQVRVISIGFYRMLKSMQTYKIIKSKSEIAALKDFLDWLEALKAKDASSLGVILVYHEERKFIPYMILESLKKYNLLDRFSMTVKSFVNSLHLAKVSVNEQLQHYTLRRLSKVLAIKAAESAAPNMEGGAGAVGGGSLTPPASAASLPASVNTNDQMPEQINNNNNAAVSQQQNVMNNGSNMNINGSGSNNNNGGGGGNNNNNGNENGEQNKQFNRQNPNQQQGGNQGRYQFDGNASVRAKLTYEVALQLSNQDHKDVLDSPAALNKMLNALQPYAQPIDCDLNELQTQNENLERQNSFRPVFLNYFKTTIYHRVRAVKFRIILAEHGYDLQNLNAVWNEKQKEGLNEALQAINDLKPNDKTELADLFDSFFDPNKTTLKPVLRTNNRRRNRRALRLNSKNDGNNNRRNGGEQGAGGDKEQGNNMPDSTTKSPARAANGYKPRRRNPRSRNNSKSKQNAMVNTTFASNVATVQQTAVVA